MCVHRIMIVAPLASGSAHAQTLEQIMAHPDWLGRQAERPYWAADGRSVYFERKVEDTEERRLYQASLDGADIRRVSDAERLDEYRRIDKLFETCLN
jgi:hypothetical protein